MAALKISNVIKLKMYWIFLKKNCEVDTLPHDYLKNGDKIDKKIPLESIQTLHESIPHRTQAVLITTDYSTPY